MLAIAAANALFCLIIIVKAVHICVGLVSFVSVAMMLIGMFQKLNVILLLYSKTCVKRPLEIRQDKKINYKW